MVTPKTLEDIAQKIQNVLPKGFDKLHEDIRQNTREAIMGVLTRMDLVSREEFDAQSEVLARTRAKLEKLERQVTAWEESQRSPSK